MTTATLTSTKKPTRLRRHTLESRPFRDCLQKVLDEGATGAPPYGRWHRSIHKALAFRLALEFKEAGYTPDDAREELREWAIERCQPPVPPQALEPHILSLVDYVYANPDTGLLCKSAMFQGGGKNTAFAISEPLCFAEDTLCEYQEWERQHLNTLWEPVQKRYHEGDWRRILLEEYGPEGHLAHRMFIALCTIGRLKGLVPRQPIIIGTRAIAKEMNRNQKKATVNAMNVSRVTHRLEEQDLITVKKPRRFRRGLANSYVVHPPAS